MNYKLNPYAKTAGTFLRDYLPGITRDHMIERFGDPSHNGYYEPEKGYHGFEWFFEDNDGNVFNVYSRWGQFRVGAQHHVDVTDFLKWINAQACGVKKIR